MSVVMRKLSSWAIIVFLTLQMSIYSIDYTNDTINFDLEESEDVSQASGRQSSSMQGNQSGEVQAVISQT